MSRVEEELVGSLTCFLIKSEKRMSIQLDQETSFQSKLLSRSAQYLYVLRSDYDDENEALRLQ